MRTSIIGTTSIGTECSATRTFPVAPTPPKLDPYQELSILNQSRLEAEEGEEEQPMPMAIKCISENNFKLRRGLSCQTTDQRDS